MKLDAYTEIYKKNEKDMDVVCEELYVYKCECRDNR